MEINKTKKHNLHTVSMGLGLSILFGFLFALVSWILQIVDNRYFYFKTYNLIFFSLQKHLNKNLLIFVLVFLILFILWVAAKKIANWIRNNFVKIEIVNYNKILALFLSLAFVFFSFVLFHIIFNLEKTLKKFPLFENIGEISQTLKYVYSGGIMLFFMCILIVSFSYLLSKLNLIKIQKSLFEAIRKTRGQTVKISFVILVFFVIYNCFVEIYKKAVPPKGPNIILLTVDTLRADHLGCYGYFRNTSPNIDKLRKDSIMFSDMITVMSHTLPSYASMLTGFYPRSHSVLMNGQKLDSSFLTITEALKNKNYLTGGFIGSFVLEKQTNLDQGFDVYDDNMKSDVEVKAAILNNKIVDWIKRKKNRKFFLFIQYFDPHIPYDPPPPFHETFDYKSDGLDQHIDFLIGREDKRKELLSSIDLYDGEIKYVDDEIGNLIKLLKDLEVYDESLIIFIADHGESLGAHNWQGHELNYEDQIKIPFLIKAPFGTFNNTTVSGQSQNLDLFNFLLDMVDSRVTKENVKQKVEKALDRIKNRAHAFIERRFYTQKSRLQFPHICSKGEEYAVRTKIWKLIHKEKEEDELYNLAQDPYELNNLIEGNSDIVDRLLGLLTSWVATHTTDFKQSEIDKKTEEKLKSLGYIK